MQSITLINGFRNGFLKDAESGRANCTGDSFLYTEYSFDFLYLYKAGCLHGEHDNGFDFAPILSYTASILFQIAFAYETLDLIPSSTVRWCDYLNQHV